MIWQRTGGRLVLTSNRWLAGLLIGVVCVGLYALWDYVAAERVTAAIVAVAHAGGSINRAQIERSDSGIDPANDAAPFYLAAASLASTGPPYDTVALAAGHGFSGVPAPAELQAWYATGDLPAGMLAHTRLIVDQQADALRLLDKATSKPFTGFGRTTTYGAQLVQFEQLCRLCNARTVYAAATGQARLAVESLESELALFADPKRPVHRPPLPRVLLSTLSLSLLLNRSTLDDEALARLARAFEQADDDRALEDDLDGMRGNYIDTFLERARYLRGFSLFVGGIPGESGVTFRPRMASRVREHLDAYRDIIGASRLPWTSRLDQVRAVAMARQWRDDSGFLINNGWSSDPWGFTAVPLNLASARVARAAIAVERYRLTHRGQLPDTLEQAVPAYLPGVPIDPYSGRPIRFVKIDGGYQVYGVSFDRADDGGDLLKDQPVIRVRR